MDPQQQFCLKWNSFGSNLVTTFDSLFKSESLTDVTLFCEGVTFKAHKLILAACSKHFQDLFEAAPHCPNVLVILDGTSSSNMSALLEFMYKGEVHVSHESLSSFLKAAECLQVKGLSIEHEKLAAAQTQQQQQQQQGQHVPGSSERELPGSESPRGGKSKCSSSIPTSNGSLKDERSERESSERERGEMLPPSTSSPYTPPVLSPYMHHAYMVAHYEQRVPPSGSYAESGPRKRHHRSPSDPLRNSSTSSGGRASVLRDGSKLERDSPLSLAYHQQTSASPQPPPYHSPRYETSSADAPPTPTPVTSVAFDRSAAVESDTPPDHWRTSSCPEDLSVKVEPPGSDRGIKNEWGYNTETSNQPPENQPPDIMSTTNVWNTSATKMSNAHKGAATATTPDGKKLQCPFCERLYGYETNLRAHIRQRHQGIRVPCPFCSRTFTRNNTVRRHIAREHKTELSLKAFQPAQVQNHNQ